MICHVRGLCCSGIFQFDGLYQANEVDECVVAVSEDDEMK